MKKNLLIPALLLLTAGLLSCGEEAVKPENNVSDTAAPATEAVTEAAPVMFSSDLAKKDFGGETVTVYSSNNINAMVNPITINYAEEETGEIVNDTLFARDLWVSEQYNVDLKFELDGDRAAWEMPAYLNGLIMAGDTTYDILLQDVAKVAYGVSIAGASYPMNMVPGIDLEKEYWFPAVNEQLKVGDNLYIAASVINPRFYGAAYLILFNKNMARDLDLDNFYDDVKKGTWTVDRMFSVSKDIAADLNGDGAYTEADRYSFGWGTLTPESMVLGAGLHYIEHSGDGLVSNMENEKMVGLCQKLYEGFNRSGVLLDGGSDVDCGTVLENGNFLFWNPATLEVQDYRDYKWDFGLLPMPKYDENQKEYVTYAQPWVVSAPVVPITLTGERLEMIGTILDGMAAYGYDYIRPAVYDNVVTTKGTRDEESYEIINNIYDNVTFELGTIFQITSDFSSFFYGEDSGIASFYAERKTQVEEKMKQTVDTYNAIADEIG